MIECVEKNIFKKKRFKNKSRIKSLIFILFFIICFIYYRYIIANNVFNVVVLKTNSIVASKVNESILNSNSNSNYNFTRIEKNEKGEIILIGLDSFAINQFSRIIVNNVEQSLNNEIKNGIEVPILAFSGIKALSGYGKNVKYNALEVSTVDCVINGDFRSVGINQAIHSIYATIKVKVVIDVPFDEQSNEFTTKVLLSENIIVGKIPEIYLGQNSK